MDFGRREVERFYTVYHSKSTKGLSSNHLVESSLMWSSFLADIKKRHVDTIVRAGSSAG